MDEVQDNGQRALAIAEKKGELTKTEVFFGAQCFVELRDRIRDIELEFEGAIAEAYKRHKTLKAEEKLATSKLLEAFDAIKARLEGFWEKMNEAAEADPEKHSKEIVASYPLPPEVTIQARYVGEVENLTDLCLWILERPDAAEWLEVDKKKIATLANSIRDSAKIPGLKVKRKFVFGVRRTEK